MNSMLFALIYEHILLIRSYYLNTDLHIEGLHQEPFLEVHKDHFNDILNQSESNFNRAKDDDSSRMDILKKRYSMASLARGDKILSTNIVFKQLNK